MMCHCLLLARCAGMDAWWWQVLLVAVGHHLLGAPAALAAGQTASMYVTTLGPAQEAQQGFLKYKSQLHCDAHPFSFVFFSLPSCFNSNILSMLSLCKITGLGALLEFLCAMDMEAEDASCTGSQTSAAACCWTFV